MNFRVAGGTLNYHILRGMIRNWIYKIRSLKLWTWLGNFWLRMSYARSSLRLRVSNYWTLSDRGAWVFFGALGLGFVTLAVLIYNAVGGKVVNRDLTCLARNVYYEARGESEKGQWAVAKVTLNRVASHRFPDSICEVVYEKRWDRRRRRYVGAFAWTELDTLPKLKRAQWQKAWQAAETVYERPKSIKLKGALFYHAARIKPRWAKQKKRVKRIGSHIFYQ